MKHSKGWINLNRLADKEKCDAAARDALGSTSHGTDGPQYTQRCADIMREVLIHHAPELDKQADLLKPGARRRSQAIAQFRPNPPLASSSQVLLFIALTKLDKTNGMFSFIEVPEDNSIPRSEWKEEEVAMEPGEGVMWRGDCERRIGDGDGGIILIILYD
ncbi:hypothetical protein B0A55_13153 [Friedmanniomyces simplex]|uniref:Uncharacterized protein n=1 Tax=Friedmanniomyces simplex TaxID=329884 RepID=A0A4U0WES8_9PEZI|nr:hypothetical protein B0A55_13153 [Friedmanniomyces simplex]